MTSPANPTTLPSDPTSTGSSTAVRYCLALVLISSRGRLEGSGRRALFPEGVTKDVGRGEGEDPPADLATFEEMRPGQPMPPPSREGLLFGPSVSRRHLRVVGKKDVLDVQVLVRDKTLHNGKPFEGGKVHAGDTIILVGEAVLLCVWSPVEMPALRVSIPTHVFGEPDDLGYVGESYLMWLLREELAMVAMRPQHVFVLGESGVGKTMTAQGIHVRSSRAKKPFRTRNVSTFTENLVASELFGIADSFASGTKGRPGLFKAADGGTAFLDEIGETPIFLQLALRTFLESGLFTVVGDVGETQVDVRVVGATNTDPEKFLKGDVGARFKHSVRVPAVREHAEDIGLILRHLLKLADATTKSGELPSSRRVSNTFIDFLLRHPLPFNVRQMEKMLETALKASPAGEIRLPPALSNELTAGLQGQVAESVPPPAPVQARVQARAEVAGKPRGRRVEEPVRSEGEVVAALEKSGGNVSEGATILEISRQQMIRLIERFGIKGRGRG